MVIEVQLEDAAETIKTHDLLFSWSWPTSREREVDLAKRSQRVRILPPVQGSTFFVELRFDKDVTGQCDSTDAQTWDGHCPLWKRKTDYAVRFVDAQDSQTTVPSETCKFTSEKSEPHGRVILPCPAGAYMRVLKEDTWFDPTSAGLNKIQYSDITADEFLDFTHRPDDHAATDMTACLSCSVNDGFECPKGSAGFHGGVNIKAGYWRVDFSNSSTFAAARCNHPDVCEAGGRCAPDNNRTGPLCELYDAGTGMKDGQCLDCEVPDFTPMAIFFGVVIIVALVVFLFRRKCYRLRYVWRDMVRITKVMIDSSQIVAAMPMVLDDIVWPDSLMRMFKFLDLASLDFTQYLGITCLNGHQLSYYSKATFLLLFMWLSTFFLVVVVWIQTVFMHAVDVFKC